MTESELYHYGILGMHWGIRRYQNSDGSLTAAGKERYNKEFAKESTKEIKTNKDGSKTIPKGFVLNRVGKSELDINQSGALYVSYGKADAARYIKALGPTPLNKLFGATSESVQHISVKQNLKMPSDKEVATQTAELLSKNKELLKTVNDSLYAQILYGTIGEKRDAIGNKELDNAIKNPDGKDGQKLAYTVSQFLGNSNYAEQSKTVYGWFRDKGYDALPDLVDRLSGTSETAMIIINPDKISLDSTTTITKDIIKSGKEYLKTVEKLKVSDLIKD